jgi:MFS family permease
LPEQRIRNTDILSFSNAVQPGLRENFFQFSVLVIINAFVGGMIGMERSILPQIAEAEFHLAAKTAIFSFIIVFGLVKAFSNYFAGSLAKQLGKKNLLVIGWLFALPVPFILMYATNWNWIIIANILLGIQQGITWSMTVVMKIDIAGEKNRGFAMGLNEFAGYLAVAAVAYITGAIAQQYGLRPYPFYIGVALSIAGLLSSVILVKDTSAFVKQESIHSHQTRTKNIFKTTTFLNPNLSAVTQAGLINNLNDAMIWGLLPVLLINKSFSLSETATIVAVYPAVWGLSQIVTGRLADRICKKSLLFWGMLLQGLVIIAFIPATTYWQYIALSFLLGIGTAMVYPTFMASIADNIHPEDRTKSIGIFRLWRDLGYTLGAILTGLLADKFSINAAILSVALLTITSALIIRFRMLCMTKNPNITQILTHKFRQLS